MAPSPPRRPDHDIVPAPAADLCLDFANTRMWRGTASPQETLHRLEDFVTWCAARGLQPPERLRQIASWWSDGSDEATAAFGETLATRELLYRLFGTVAAG